MKKSCHVLGVNWNDRDKRWMAQPNIGGKQRYLGSFAEEAEAVEAVAAGLEMVDAATDSAQFRW